MIGSLHEKVDSVRILSYDGKTPKIGENVLIAPGVKIIGDVEIGNNSSIWFNSVLRGDINYIKIGTFTNIQDSSVIHLTKEQPVNIGNYVTVGHAVKLHACTLKDYTLIGIGSIILDNAVVSEYSFIAAGSLILQKTVVPSGKLVAGVPGKIVRDLRNDEIESIKQSAFSYYKYAEQMMISLNKS
jgi:carbonic anhydrase/acetyltransferase-like protein (isoleucine patch superfamily)